MSRVGATGPGRGSRAGRDDGDGQADVVLRVMLVVALVATAGLLLPARQGLDWGELADPLQVRWSRVVAGAVVLVLLATLARRLLQRLLRPQRPAGAGDTRAEPAGEQFPVLLRVLAVVVVLAVLAMAWFVIDAVSGQAPEAARDARPPSAADAGVAPVLTGPDWPTLLVAAAVLLALAAAARLPAVRRDRAANRRSAEPDVEPDAAEIASAVSAAQVELAAPGDARSRIVAAYLAMAASIEAGLARRGRPASAADTPTELLHRAATAGLVDGDAAATLTGLFHEARFSRHQMGDPERRAAELALSQVRGEAARRA